MDYNRCSIFMADLPDTDDNVQKGVRPVMIVSNNINNKFNSNVTIIPLTSRGTCTLPTHVKVIAPFLKYESIALCENIMTISKRRLKQKLGETSMKNMLDIQNAMAIQLGDLAM